MTKHFFLIYLFNPWLLLWVTLDKACLPNANWNEKDEAVLIVKASTDPHWLSPLNTRAVN